MKKTLRTSLAAAAVAAVPFAFAQEAVEEVESAEQETATVGEAAPGFTLTDAEGNEHNLSDFAGSIVVLEWVNFDCPFVANNYETGNIPGLQSKYAEGDDGVVWLTINSSAEGEQGHVSGEGFTSRAEEEGWAGTALLEDHDGTVGHLYEAKTTPHLYVIDEEGTLVYAGAVDSLPSQSATAEERAEADQYVAAAIDALRADEEIATAETDAYGCSIKY